MAGSTGCDHGPVTPSPVAPAPSASPGAAPALPTAPVSAPAAAPALPKPALAEPTPVPSAKPSLDDKADPGTIAGTPTLGTPRPLPAGSSEDRLAGGGPAAGEVTAAVVDGDPSTPPAVDAPPPAPSVGTSTGETAATTTSATIETSPTAPANAG